MRYSPTLFTHVIHPRYTPAFGQAQLREAQLGEARINIYDYSPRSGL